MTDQTSPLSSDAYLRFMCDHKSQSSPLIHHWEHTIGSGHATLTLRADWQKQMRKCREELGFQYVRFHGLLCDDMGTFLIYADKPLYSFFNIDQVFDFLVSIGMKPFVELSFMPTGLSSGDQIVFHYKANVTPPRDYDLWAELIRRLASHWIDRFGAEEVRSWFFEVWNEPNLHDFFASTQADYFKLYRSTSDALKSVDKDLKVGGPATAANAWIPDFLSFCESNSLSPDFISTHHYPTDAFGKPGDDTESQLAASERSVLRKQSMIAANEAKGKPLYYTEWSSSSNPRDALHDEPYAAAFAVKTIMEVTGLVKAYSWWTFSDIFEENYFPSVPFHGGFGLLTIHGIPKPVYRAYELLHSLGTELLPVEGNHSTVDVWVVKGDNATTILITNYALPRHPISSQNVRIELKNISKPARATIKRIDEDNANPRRRWHELGEPEHIKHDDLEVLLKASEMLEETQDFSLQDRGIIFDVEIPPQGIAAVRLVFSNSGHA